MGRVLIKVGWILEFFSNFYWVSPQIYTCKNGKCHILKDPPPPNTLDKYYVGTCPQLVPPFFNFQRIVPNLESKMTRRYFVKTKVPHVRYIQWWYTLGLEFHLSTFFVAFLLSTLLQWSIVNIIEYGHYVNMVPFFFPFNVRFKFQVSCNLIINVTF